ncbi:hypothetical protein FVE85_5689 [Porphyridium purpureum]|uniref:Uncharacterized protein n=1 Tax=Porphyridium purpureum TaxID=35688 RepID=A0A5J4Z560_PORPP|nr:hypothetical protein FVE85_5689 [Porphyridium purpureum]|eukprot:POR8914..scf295_1
MVLREPVWLSNARKVIAHHARAVLRYSERRNPYRFGYDGGLNASTSRPGTKSSSAWIWTVSVLAIWLYVLQLLVPFACAPSHHDARPSDAFVPPRTRRFQTLVPEPRPLAFAVWVDAASYMHTARLIDALFRPVAHNDVLFVLPDASVPREAVAQLRARLAGNEAQGKLHVLAPEAVTEHGVSLLLAYLSMIQLALCHAEQPQWTHTLLLRASDYPQVPHRVLRELVTSTRPLPRAESQVGLQAQDVSLLDEADYVLCKPGAHEHMRESRSGDFDHASLLSVDAREAWARHRSRWENLFFDAATAVYPEWSGSKPQKRNMSTTEASMIAPSELNSELVYRWPRGRPCINGSMPCPAYLSVWHPRSLPRCSRLAMLSRELAACAVWSPRARALEAVLATAKWPVEHYFCTLAVYSSFYCADGQLEHSFGVPPKPRVRAPTLVNASNISSSSVIAGARLDVKLSPKQRSALEKAASGAAFVEEEMLDLLRTSLFLRELDEPESASSSGAMMSAKRTSAKPLRDIIDRLVEQRSSRLQI